MTMQQGNSQNNYLFPSLSMDETPLLPFDELHVERDSVVTLRPLKPSQWKNETLTFGGFKGKAYFNQNSPEATIRNQKYWIGHPMERYPDGSYKWKKIKIMDGRMYFLSNPEDAREYHVIRHHFSVKGSPNESYGAARWIMESEKAKAATFMQKASSFVDVWEFIKGMTDAQIKDFGRLTPFALDPDNNTVEIIRGQLVQRAYENPKVFEPFMKNERLTAVHTAFQRGLTTQMIIMDHERGYLFNGNVPMGLNEQQVLLFLGSRNDLLVTLDAESKRLVREANDRKDTAEKAKVEKLDPILPAVPKREGMKGEPVILPALSGENDGEKKTDRVNDDDF